MSDETLTIVDSMTPRARVANASSVTLDTDAHLFDERDPARRMDAVAAIEAARAEVDVREVQRPQVLISPGASKERSLTSAG